MLSIIQLSRSGSPVCSLASGRQTTTGNPHRLACSATGGRQLYSRTSYLTPMAPQADRPNMYLSTLPSALFPLIPVMATAIAIFPLLMVGTQSPRLCFLSLQYHSWALDSFRISLLNADAPYPSRNAVNGVSLCCDRLSCLCRIFFLTTHWP